MLRKISLPLKTKENDRNILKEEELYIEEVQMLVSKYNYIIFIYFYFQYCEKNNNFIPVGFETKEEDAEDADYGEMSVEEYGE